VVGKWFAANPEKREDIFLATKFGIEEMLDPRKLNTTPEYVKMACERSLKKLQTDYVDLYYMHRTDGRTPIEKTVQAMKELKE
jgi:aryl-alcohol dehydrogenase-like predicted oxidoreductase